MRVFEVDLIGEVVAATSNVMTPIITQAEAAQTATGVHYMFGRDEEIIERLALLSKNEDAKDKYPLVWLVTPFVSSVDISQEEREITFPKIYFINGADKDMISPQRYEYNFKPVLCPIVDEFIRQLNVFSYGFYKPFNTSELTYNEIIHDYWGRVKGSGGQGNALTDILDAVELSNFKVKLSYKNC